MQEELVFSEHYLHLFRGRYGNQTKILYDFDSETLKCLIIRNILQPLIENYFEHGFEGQRSDNCLRLSAEIIENDKLLITVQDNGRGMTEEDIVRLRDWVYASETNGGEHYGLKNLQQRVRLFYGENYGIKIDHNVENGLSVSILLPILKER
ncbi:MAG: hypothetical protein IJ048_08505 [Clostridia bacterium]|nr:hypothetical protein [Clostridia bacterium]